MTWVLTFAVVSAIAGWLTAAWAWRDAADWQKRYTDLWFECSEKKKWK